MALDPRTVANYTLDRADKTGMAITNLALNKILYFAHGWHLAASGEPLLDTSFEAWPLGPVIPIIYHQFKKHGDRPIYTRATQLDFKTGRDVLCRYNRAHLPLAFLDPILDFYSAKNGYTLSHMSHEAGAPWALRRDSPTPGMIISDGVIRAYFEGRLAQRSGRDVN